MRDFRQLKVWQKAHALVLNIYGASRDFPSEERFGLTIQLRRASVSFASNIAEGCGRSSNPALSHFLSIAAGSESEVEYQLLLARDLNYLDKEQHHKLDVQINEVKRMLNSFMQKLS